MVAEGTCGGVAAHDGGLAELEGIVETCLGCMAEVNHHADTVHFGYDLFAELAHTAMFVVATGRVADVVVAVVAECHIDHTPLAEGFDIVDVVADGVAVFDAEHDGAFASAFESPEVVGGVGDIDSCAVLCHHFLDLGEDLVCLGGGVLKGCLVTLLLFEIGDHDAGIEVSFGHLVEVNEYLGVTGCEVDALREEHGGVAMAVEGDDFGVQFLCLLEFGTLADEPFEDGEHVGAVAKDIGLGMPLHTQNGLEFVGFDCFDDSVGADGGDGEAGGSGLASLMVEGVDCQFGAKEFGKDGAIGDGNLMGWIAAVLVLAVLDAYAFHLCVDVLIVGATKGGIDDLDALADAQHGDLAVVGKACQQQLLQVTLGGDAVEFLDRLLAQQQGVDVATTAEDDAVEAVEEFAEAVSLVEGRNDEGDATCLEH